MKIINFGSLNIDKVYAVDHIAAPGETVSAAGLTLNAGGKGLNQSLAAARAGAQVLHAGAIGPDGAFLEQLLKDSGVDTSPLLHVGGESGHAVIQVDAAGQNSIVVYGGANHALTEDYVRQVLDRAQPGDIVLLQNEINVVEPVLRTALLKGLTVCFNPSPIPTESLPYNLVDIFLVNETEAAALADLPAGSEAETILDNLGWAYPRSTIVLTLGEKGALCRSDGGNNVQKAFPVAAVDTTAAGDTFTGYFLAGLCQGKDLTLCLKEAAAAAALAVSRPGAAPSIPSRDEVEAFLKK